MADSIFHCTKKSHLPGYGQRHWIGVACDEAHARLQANKVLTSDPRLYEVNRLTEPNDVVHVQLWVGSERG